MSCENPPRVSTRARIGDVVTTVAVRGTFVMSAISPTHSPAARSRSFRPLSGYGDGAIDQDEELAPEPTLFDQCLALGPLDLVGEIRDHAEFLLRATGKERNSGDQFDFRVFVETHGAIVTEPAVM